MTFEHGFGALEDALIEAFHRPVPHFHKAEQLLAQGADLNAGSKYRDRDSENVLSEILLGCWHVNYGNVQVEVESDMESMHARTDELVGQNVLSIVKFAWTVDLM